MQYAADVDLDVLNDVHTLGVLLVPPGSRVLDLGCATGAVAARLRERGCRVWGVEVDETAARRARAQCEAVITADVETIDPADLAEQLSAADREVDVILALDVLEHLRDPAGLLRRFAPLLAPTGRVVASIPNVGHGSLRLSLLRGRFEYQEAGLLDRGHLRLYDAASVDDLFADADMIVVERLRVTRGLTEAGVDVDPADFADEVVAEVMADPEALTFQFVRVAVPRGSRMAAAFAAGTMPDSLADRLQARVEQLETLVRDGADHLGRLEAALAGNAEAVARSRSRVADLEAELAELEETLRERMGELAESETSRRHLELDLHVKDAYIEELRIAAVRAVDREAALTGDAETHRGVATRLEAEVAELQVEIARLRTEVERFQHLRYRAVDRVNDVLWRIPLLHRTAKALVRAGVAVRRRVRRRRPSAEEVAG